MNMRIISTSHFHIVALCSQGFPYILKGFSAVQALNSGFLRGPDHGPWEEAEGFWGDSDCWMVNDPETAVFGGVDLWPWHGTEQWPLALVGGEVAQ